MTSTESQARRGRQSGGRSDGLGEPDRLSVRALARGLSILSLYDVHHRAWTIDEIAERTGLLRMTAYRMVRTLEAAEYIARDTSTNKYHLGPATIAMAYVANDHSEFVEQARPFLADLVESTGESVTLAVPVDDVPVCVSVLSSARPFRHEAAPGRIISDLASVLGEILRLARRKARRGPRPDAVPAHALHGHRPRCTRRGAWAHRRRRRGVRSGGPVREHLRRRLTRP